MSGIKLLPGEFKRKGNVEESGVRTQIVMGEECIEYSVVAPITTFLVTIVPSQGE